MYCYSNQCARALVQSWGGRALALPFVEGQSTTGLVRRIRQAAP